MKRTLAIAFALALAATLAGCDKPGNNAGSGSSSSGSSATGSSSSGAAGSGGVSSQPSEKKKSPAGPTGAPGGTK